MDYAELARDLESHADLIEGCGVAYDAAAENMRRGAKAIRVIPDLLAALQELVATRSEAERAEPLTERRDIAAIAKWQQRWIAAFASARAALAKATGSPA